MSHYDFLSNQIEDCEKEIIQELTAERPPQNDSDDPPVPPKAKLKNLLQYMLGVDLPPIPTISVEVTLTIASELGNDLSIFPTQAYFCSWLGLAPGIHINEGKKYRLESNCPSFNRISQITRLTAMSTRKRQTFIGAKHRTRLARRDTRCAGKATAHELARLIYSMLTKGEEYIEKEIEAFEMQRQEQKMAKLKREAKGLGFWLIQSRGRTHLSLAKPRFAPLLVKPDMRFSRIRLSTTITLRPRKSLWWFASSPPSPIRACHPRTAFNARS